MATTRKQSGFLIQSNYGRRRNFELVIPCSGTAMAHYWRANDTDQFPLPISRSIWKDARQPPISLKISKRHHCAVHLRVRDCLVPTGRKRT